MLHMKIQDCRPFSSWDEEFQNFFTIYKHDSHLGHETHYLIKFKLLFSNPTDALYAIWL